MLQHNLYYGSPGGFCTYFYPLNHVVKIQFMQAIEIKTPIIKETNLTI